MKSLLFVFFASTAWCQIPPASAPNLPANLTPDTLLATIDGKKLTYGDFQKYLSVLPPQMQQAALRDRKAFVEQYALMQRLAGLAEKERLDQQSPYKESLTFNRTYVMMNAELNESMNRIVVPPAEQQKYYEANKDKYRQVKLKVIYVSFVSNPSAQPAGAKKHLTEAEAKSKIEKLLADIRTGADFVKLVKEHSEDKTSAEKDGDFGTIRRSDSIPDAIRSVVFSLKPGQVSEPVQQPNGYYLFRAEEVSARPYDEVKDEIHNEVKTARHKEWIEGTRKSLQVKFENEAFFAGSAAAPKK
jgi:peptidyl-prolyl cis-trans isomerase C